MECYIDKLREKGLKVTPRRMAIVKIFLANKTHLTPEEVWSRLSKEFDKCGLPSVYRNLETLVECGVLTRIQQFDRKMHYALCGPEHGHHRHHITCVECGRVEDIEDCAFPDHKKIKGFKILNHFFQVNGVCEECLTE